MKTQNVVSLCALCGEDYHTLRKIPLLVVAASKISVQFSSLSTVPQELQKMEMVLRMVVMCEASIMPEKIRQIFLKQMIPAMINAAQATTRRHRS